MSADTSAAGDTMVKLVELTRVPGHAITPAWILSILSNYAGPIHHDVAKEESEVTSDASLVFWDDHRFDAI